MPRETDRPDDPKAAPERRPVRQTASLVCSVALSGLLSRAVASELVISREALQTLVATSVFNDQGRWNLVKGKCYAYLERPHITLGADRVIIDAHLSSRLGVVVGDSCVGTELASNVRVSGRLVGMGSHIRIDDIRIDTVQDESTRSAVQLLQSATGGSLPKTADIDLLPLLKPTSVPGTDIKVSASALSIGNVSTHENAVDVQFEIKLAAR